ncbi:hypothetical protein Gotur_032414, partial [Gossypium turneri]
EYICIIAHWVDKDWKLQKRIIRFRALFPPYDGLNIADELVLCLSQWVRCCAHILNLIVKAGLELADDVVDVLDYWGQRDKDYQMFALSNKEWRNVAIYCFKTIYGIHADFVETILSNLRLLFDEYVKKSKSTSSSLAGSSNVSDKNPVDSGLDEHNVNSANFGGYFDRSDDYKRYLDESSTRSEKSQLDIYLEEPELELIVK